MYINPCTGARVLNVLAATLDRLRGRIPSQCVEVTSCERRDTSGDSAVQAHEDDDVVQI